MQGNNTNEEQSIHDDHKDAQDVSREDLIDALREAHQQIFGLQEQLKEYAWLTEALRRRTWELSERVKELECLYRVSDCILDRNSDLVELLQRVITLLPRGFQTPDNTWALLNILGQIFQSPGFRQTEYSFCTKIFASRKQIGHIQIFVSPPSHAREAPVLLIEETILVDTLSQWIGAIVEHRMLRERF